MKGLKLLLTSIRVGFCSVSILQTIAPRPLIPGPADRALQLPVTTFEPLSPLPSVLPPAFALHADAVPFALRPGTLVAVPAGPRVHTQDLKTMTPCTGVLPLTLGSSADPTSMGLTLLPPPAVRPPIIKVKPASSGHAWNRFWQILRMSRKKKTIKRRTRAWSHSGGETREEASSGSGSTKVQGFHSCSPAAFGMSNSQLLVLGLGDVSPNNGEVV